MGEALHFTPDEARQEEERAKSTSCPGTQTSTRRALWSCTQLSPFLLVSVGFTSRPCPVEQLLPGRDFTARPSLARQTTPFFIFFFEGKRACCLPSSYVFFLPLFLPFFPLFSCHLCSLWKAGAAAWEPDRRAQRKQQLPSLAQQAEIPGTNPKSRVSNTLQCYKKHEEFTCSCSRTFFWQLDQATRLV